MRSILHIFMLASLASAFMMLTSSQTHAFGFTEESDNSLLGGLASDTSLQLALFLGGGLGYFQQSMVAQGTTSKAQYTGYGWNLGTGIDFAIGDSFGFRFDLSMQNASLPNKSNTDTQSETISISSYGAAIHIGWNQLAAGVGIETISSDITRVGGTNASTSSTSGSRTTLHASYNFITLSNFGGNLAAKYSLANDLFSNDVSLTINLFFILKIK